MRKKIETRKKIGRICALVVVGMFVVMTLPTSVVAPPGATPWTGTLGGDPTLGWEQLGTATPDDLRIVTGGVQRMVVDGITGTGNVGIGLFPGIPPMNKLDVADNVAVGVAYAGRFPAPPNGMIVEGWVGIGTPSPGTTLHVKTYQADRHIRVEREDQYPYPEGTYMDLISGGAFCAIDCVSTYDEVFQIQEDGIARLHIRKGGNVGIGTTSPSQTLHVQGDARITGALYDSNNDAGTSGQILQTTGSGIDWVDPSSVVSDGDWTISGSDMYSAVSGNVGIGTTSPSTKLDVNGVITATGGNSDNWNTAYGWGDHALAGYITAVYGDNGLTGGGTSGDVHLNVGAGTGISVSADAVALAPNYVDGSAYDSRFVNEGQSNSITTGMIVDRAVDGTKIAVGSHVTGSLKGSDKAVFKVTNTNNEANWDAAAIMGEVTGSADPCYRVGVHGKAGDASMTPAVKVGVWGESDTGIGVMGLAKDKMGVYGSSTNSDGVRGMSTNAYGGWFWGQSGSAVLAVTHGTNLYEGYSTLSSGVPTNLRFKVTRMGNVYATSYNTWGDFAEMIEVSQDSAPVEPGDVLVIGSDKARTVEISSAPYSTLVAGIYSTNPGFVGSEDPMEEGEDEVPVAVVGIVPCKVSAENGPIQEGDLLTTSSTPGHAMKVTDRSMAIGAIVGKALESHDSGTGVIRVLVTLQ